MATVSAAGAGLRRHCGRLERLPGDGAAVLRGPASLQLKLSRTGSPRSRLLAVMIISLALSVSLMVTALASYQRFTNSSVVRLPHVFRVQPRHNSLEPFYQNSEFSDFASVASFVVSARVQRAVAAASALTTAQTTNFVAALTAGPAEQTPPLSIPVRFCDSDLFAMFAIPFRFGDRGGAPMPAARTKAVATDVAVLNSQLNDRWFGGANSVVAPWWSRAAASPSSG